MPYFNVTIPIRGKAMVMAVEASTKEEAIDNAMTEYDQDSYETLEADSDTTDDKCTIELCDEDGNPLSATQGEGQ